MKNYNLLITILLAMNLVSCGDSRSEIESYFSFDEGNLKAMYQANEKVELTLLNSKNKTIDSIVYSVNDTKISSVKGNGKFTLDLKDKKLGYQNVKALVYFEGDTVSTKTRIEVASSITPKLLKYTIVNTYDHDVKAFTEGFEFFRDTLMESTGTPEGYKGYFAKIDYKTGKAYKKVDLDAQYFGEGITVVNNKIYQLTWQNKTGFIYDANSLKKLKTFTFDKNIEGWGMTNDGKTIYQSDGTEKIWMMNPETQKMTDFINVYTNDSKIKSINELEWINGKIFGNIWQKDAIAVINPQTGAVEAVLDLSALRAKVTNKEAEVLNGIAYHRKTNTLFVTGKLWNKTFEIKVSE
ncbi:glutaminyl-peptide cyclotransferase [Flavobacterium sp. XGLA_31]|uniref:glutaminyl-peptide cyclotransferase n=1 Tax=Flavobacterium sp. XGLA_31 TaxID=3447666 RepID=UPI003F2DF2D6